MDERKILLVKLSRRDSVVTTLVGAAVVGLVLEAALSRADLPPKKRRPFHVYVDEFQRFATQDMAVLLTEGRKFAIATTVAHQFRDQLDHANRAATLNTTNLVVFRVTGEDREELASLFSPASLAEAERDTGDQRTYVDKRNKIERSLASLQKYVAHVKVGGSEYTVATRPPKEGHSSLEREARLKQIQNQTREKYCKPSSEVDKEIEVRRSLLIRGQLPRTSRPATETPEDLTKPRQRSIEEFGQ